MIVRMIMTIIIMINHNFIPLQFRVHCLFLSKLINE